MNQGPGSAGETFEVGHHQNGLAVCQELQGRFPGLQTQYPKTISHIPSPPREWETEEEITWRSYTQNTST